MQGLGVGIRPRLRQTNLFEPQSRGS